MDLYTTRVVTEIYASEINELAQDKVKEFINYAKI